MSIDLKGSRVFISAGASGIGRAMVDTFVKANAKVYTCDVVDETLEDLRAKYPSVKAVNCDCADYEAVSAMFEDIEKTLGGLDVLVNNVGIAGPTARVEDIELDDWQRTLDVNITAHFYCTKLATPMLKANQKGAVINLSSVAGRLGFPLRLPYAASKWAVVGFTKTLAAELGPDNIRSNAILPGIVDGERIDRVIDAKAKAMNISFDAMREKLVSGVAMRTSVSPYDIANMAVFLSSDMAQKVSGQIISVDGDVLQIS
ncbi:SDR family oxidoreductase [Hwanghaeella sp.]|uniref:SDR family oxidoreductase n=1 Tax=Hwanghaeella sp. TaxID=2605943 RepID=UPI003CCBD244